MRAEPNYTVAKIGYYIIHGVTALCNRWTTSTTQELLMIQHRHIFHILYRYKLCNIIALFHKESLIFFRLTVRTQSASNNCSIDRI